MLCLRVTCGGFVLSTEGRSVRMDQSAHGRDAAEQRSVRILSVDRKSGGVLLWLISLGSHQR